MKPLSLRARLVLGVLVLGAAGLVAADAFTYTSLSAGEGPAGGAVFRITLPLLTTTS
jgi:hypothetical protein